MNRYRIVCTTTEAGVEGLGDAVKLLNEFIAGRDVNTEPNLHAFVSSLSNAEIEPLPQN